MEISLVRYPSGLREESAKLRFVGSNPTRTSSMKRTCHSRLYTIDEDFFNKWTPEMSYVLGFWFADGYMRHEKSYRIIFFENDKEILEQIKRVLKSTHPIRKNKKDNCYFLNICSKKLYQRLQELGGCRRKSKTVNFPDIPADYLRDYIRGYFDGDGSVFYVKYNSTRDKKQRLELRSNFTCGSKMFLEKLENILRKKISFKKKRLGVYDGGSSWKLGYGTKETIKLLKFIYYSNFSLGLQRKAVFCYK